MFSRTEKYRKIREEMKKENKEFDEKTVDQIFDDMDKSIKMLYESAQELIEKARRGEKK